MTEAEVRVWLRERLGVSRETEKRLERLAALTIDANQTQNLIARSTVEEFWNRHILDSAQLIARTGNAGAGPWIDLGSGAGFPGLVVALLQPRPVILIETRRLRVAHLAAMVDALELGGRVTVAGVKVESYKAGPAAIISARAYAPLDRLLASAVHLADKNTLWLLPKGKSAASELEASRSSWHGSFSVVQSLSDPEGGIIVASGVTAGRQT